MNRRRQGVAALAAGVLLAATGIVAEAAGTDACDAVYTSNTIANLRKYEACRDDRIDAANKAILDKLNASPAPTPAPDPTTPAPAPTTQAPTPTPTPTDPPAPTPTGAGCTNPSITFTDQGSQGVGDGYDISQEEWGVKAGYAATLKFCSKDSWNVQITSKDTGDHAVQAYPSIRKIYHDWSGKPFSDDPKLSSFPKLTVDFSTTLPATCSKCIYETAFDSWLNGIADDGTTEQMIWLANQGQTPAGDIVAKGVQLSGRSWTVWASSDHGYVAFVPDAAITAGTVDIKAFTQYQIDHGLMATTTLPGGNTDPYVGQISLGVEPVATSGQVWSFDKFNINES